MQREQMRHMPMMNICLEKVLRPFLQVSARANLIRQPPRQLSFEFVTKIGVEPLAPCLSV